MLCFFWQARIQRGNVLLKQGNLKEAQEDFQKVVSIVQLTLDIIIIIMNNG